jgi:CPA2 family monovalent cation:H+ antiporter-2
MNSVSFLQDLAVVMIVAGLVTLAFHWFKQPVILGYLLAGFIIGPFTPPFSFVDDLVAIETMADLGVVFLMFSLGLEFNLRTLKRVGLTALLIAAFEILVVMLGGYLMGSAFGWSRADSVLLGIMLALTSTMIVVKGLRDRDELKTRHAELVTGVSLFDDMFVILLMVALPGFAKTGSLPTLQLVMMLSGLFVFLVAAVVIGLLVVPRLLRFIARHANDETLLIVSLGLCFGLSLFAVRLGFSAALGAFLIGAVVAEAREAGRVTALMGPLRDMFCAVFFVAIGMQIDPVHLVDSLLPALLITAGYLVIKIFACALGAFLTGTEAPTAMRFGTNMAQLGEFAFILAALAADFGISSPFLYPLVVTVASINALVRPYLVDNADAITARVVRSIPQTAVAQLSLYRQRAAALASRRGGLTPRKLVAGLLFQIALNLALIAGGFLVAGYLNRRFPGLLDFVPGLAAHQGTLWWLATVVLLLPLFIATFRKMQAMAMMLAELMMRGARDSARARVLRGALAGVLVAVQSAFLALLTLMVSAALLPPVQTLIVLLLLLALLIARFGRAFNKWYTSGKFALVSTFQEAPPVAEPPPPPPPLPAPLRDACLEQITLPAGPHAGQLIREVGLRSATGASIVAIERDAHTLVNPGPDLELLAGDRILLLGDQPQLAAARTLLENSET